MGAVGIWVWDWEGEIRRVGMAEELERWEIFWRRLGWRVMFHGLELKEVINIRLGRKKQAGWLAVFFFVAILVGFSQFCFFFLLRVLWNSNSDVSV